DRASGASIARDVHSGDSIEPDAAPAPVRQESRFDWVVRGVVDEDAKRLRKAQQLIVPPCIPPAQGRGKLVVLLEFHSRRDSERAASQSLTFQASTTAAINAYCG